MSMPQVWYRAAVNLHSCVDLPDKACEPQGDPQFAGTVNTRTMASLEAEVFAMTAWRAVDRDDDFGKRRLFRLT